MADYVTLPAAGVDVAAEEVSGRHYEMVKLVRGDVGSSTPVNPASEENQNPLDKYALYATEYGATYNYICKEDKTGGWYIQRETISTGIRDYKAGTSGVAAAWTDRGSEPYGLFSGVF